MTPTIKLRFNRNTLTGYPIYVYLLPTVDVWYEPNLLAFNAWWLFFGIELIFTKEVPCG